MQSHHSTDKGRWFGLFFILLGIGWLFKKMDTDIFPAWLLSWPSAVILLGLFVGIKHRFARVMPFVLILIGSLFLARNYFGLDYNFNVVLWPSLLILFGLLILIKPKKSHKKCQPMEEIVEETDDLNKLAISSVFCGAKKRVLSKSFEGGQISAIFGGTELNLSQADFEGEAVLDISIVFGGVKIVVPSNWEIKTNLTTVAAGIEDKRMMLNMEHSPEKTLILEGSVVLGGIEIVSH